MAVAAAPPGATYVPPSAASELAAVLHPAQPGGIPALVANDLTIARYHVGVSLIRHARCGLVVLTLALALLSDRLRRRMLRRSVEEQIGKRFHVSIVPVADLGSSHEGHTLIAVPDFTGLAGLARSLEPPILYEVNLRGERTFAVDDGAHRYVTTAIERRQGRRTGAAGSTDPRGTGPALTSARVRSGSPALRTQRPSRRRSPTARRPTACPGGRWRRVAVSDCSFWPGSTTLTLSFTASTTVPTSNVGSRSRRYRSRKALRPAAAHWGSPASRTGRQLQQRLLPHAHPGKCRQGHHHVHRSVQLHRRWWWQ